MLQNVEERLIANLKESVESAKTLSTHEMENLEAKLLEKLRDTSDVSAAELSRLETRLESVADEARNLGAQDPGSEDRLAELAAAIEQLESGLDEKMSAQTTSIEQSIAAAEEQMRVHADLIGRVTTTTSQEASQLEAKLVARIKAASDASVIKFTELEEEMWEHIAKVESESRASDREHDERIAQIDANRKMSERTHSEQLQALTRRVSEAEATVGSQSTAAQQRADNLEEQLRTAEMRSSELRELLQSCAQTVDTLAQQHEAIEGRIDTLSSSIDEHHHVFSETCEMLDQKTAMLDKKCALKLASAPPEKLAVLASQMDQLRMSLSATPSGSDTPRGADVWRTDSESVLSRTRSASTGGGSILSNIFSGTGPASPDSSPTARKPDHALHQRLEKMESRMNSFEETAWDEKHGTKRACLRSSTPTSWLAH
jgi:ABC-type transporter Mla subunit MlaD